MGNVGFLFLKIVIYIIALIVLFFGIRGLIKTRKDKTKCKKKYIISSIVPILLLFSIYFSGLYRKPPVNAESLNCIALALKNTEGVKGEQYYLNEVSYINSQSVFYSGLNRVESCEITLLETAEKLDDIESFDDYSFLEEIFCKSIETSEGKFFCSPLYSDRDAPFEVVVHSGYTGCLYYDDLTGNVYEIRYEISRLSDKILGIVYAPPVFGFPDIANLIDTETGESRGAAYVACDNYILDNYPEIAESDYSFSEICYVSEYNDDLQNRNSVGLYDTPYNNSVFPKIDEKYNDKYLIFYCDNEEYDKVSKVILFVVEVDNGEILEVIDKRLDNQKEVL